MARIAAVALLALSGCVAAIDFDAFSRSSPDAGTPPPASSNDAGVAPAPDAGPDAGSDAASPSVGAPKLVQAAQAFIGDNAPLRSSLGVALAPTAAGNLLVVAIVVDTTSGASVVTVTDSANDVFVSANERSADPTAGNTSDLWYAKATAGVTRATVTLSGNRAYEIWALELSGVSTLDTGSELDGDGSERDGISAPTVTPSVPQAFVISVGSSSAAVVAIAPGNPFTSLPIQNGNDVAWLAPTATGSYGAAWSLDPAGTSAALTVAFR